MNILAGVKDGAACPGEGCGGVAGECRRGGNLASAIKSKQEFLEQQAERGAFFDRMKTLMQRRQAEWPWEFQYWQSKGWL